MLSIKRKNWISVYFQVCEDDILPPAYQALQNETDSSWQLQTFHIHFSRGKKEIITELWF